MTDDDPPTLQYHHPDSPVFSVAYITSDEQQFRRRRMAMRKDETTSIHAERETVAGEERYLVYSRKAPAAVMPDFETDDDVHGWLDEHFDDGDVPVLLAVADIFDGIVHGREDLVAPYSFYKQMELEKLPAILDRVPWEGSVPEVGGGLLSAFVLAHPMPKANHRTAIGLLDRYLASVDDAYALPDAGADGEWFQRAADYIYDSKRLILLRRTTPILTWARNAGYRRVERKEGIRIHLDDVDFDRSDHYERYTDEHRARSREFVGDLVEAAGAPHLRDAVDDGRRAFEARFAADE